MKEYTVAQSPELSKLIEQVNELIREGWIPQGGIHTVLYYGNYFFAQAMIKTNFDWYVNGGAQ